VGGHVPPEVCAVGVVQHGQQGEGVPQEAPQLPDVPGGGRRLAQGEGRLQTLVVWANQYL